VEAEQRDPERREKQVSGAAKLGPGHDEQH
jgi:hypothetical protein